MVRVLVAFLLMAVQHAQAAETIQLSCNRPNGPKEGLAVNMADRHRRGTCHRRNRASDLRGVAEGITRFYNAGFP
jgi:hypothetical protein